MASAKHHFTRNLAAAFMSGEWTATAMQAQAVAACGKRHRWIRSLVRRVLTAYPMRPRHAALTTFLDADRPFKGVWTRSLKSPSGARRLQIVAMFWFPPQMDTTAVPVATPVPPLPTVGSVAAWLGRTPGQLDWLADLKGWNSADGPGFEHYRYRWVPKRAAKPAGAVVGHRLLEVPKAGLRWVQRKILREILAPVPPHPAARAFAAGGSVLSNAAPHVGRDVVVKFDLSDFFPSVHAARVHGVFRTLGYPVEVVRLLTGICTNRVSIDVWRIHPGERPDPRLFEPFRERHLPQGAPTSPALANLAAYHLDCRLAGLAEYFGAAYTRYADDLTFSGDRDLFRKLGQLRTAVTDVAAAEGFAVNVRKTRVAGRGQRQVVTGVVVNSHPNVPRDEFDRLKATLTNCVRHGPAAQNRAGHPDFRAHLLGRVAHVAFLNPARGAKLRAVFDRIAWPA